MSYCHKVRCVQVVHRLSAGYSTKTLMSALRRVNALTLYCRSTRVLWGNEHLRGCMKLMCTGEYITSLGTMLAMNEGLFCVCR